MRNLVYEKFNLRSPEEDMNTLNKWISFTEEQMTEFYNLGERMKACLDQTSYIRKKLLQKRRMDARRVYQTNNVRTQDRGDEPQMKKKIKEQNFECTCLDWFRFWNQFETEVDKVEMCPFN